jgi:hypothetical protein
MMQHLRDAQTDLSYLPSAGDIYNQQPVHQANVTTMADLVAQRLFDDYNLPQPSAIPSPPTLPAPDHHVEVANSLQRRETDVQSREAATMAQMQDMMLTLMRSNGNQTTTANHSPRNGSGNDNRNNCGGRNATGRGTGGRSSGRGNNRSPTRLYCVGHMVPVHILVPTATHLASNGHQSSASFSNMMNGSTNGCYWL